MSSSLDPRDVLAYLNELGYTNITAQQLKDFVKDLKKLIKYDQRKQHQRIKPPLTTNIPELSKFAKVDSYLYSTSTASSKAKEVKKPKENIITVEVKHMRKKKDASTKTEVCHHRMKDQEVCEEKTKKLADSIDKEKEKEDSSNVNETEGAESEINVKLGKKSKSLGQLSSKTRGILKPKSSFIRPKVQLKTSKSDPVALYHQYQAEWKKIRFPGEDTRADLRWAIRERMMGDTGKQRCVSAAASVDGLARKKQGTRNV